MFSIYGQYDFKPLTLHRSYFVPVAYTELTSRSFVVCILRGLKTQNQTKTKCELHMGQNCGRTILLCACMCLAKSGAQTCLVSGTKSPILPYLSVAHFLLRVILRSQLFLWLHPELPLGQNTKKSNTFISLAIPFLNDVGWVGEKICLRNMGNQ